VPKSKPKELEDDGPTKKIKGEGKATIVQKEKNQNQNQAQKQQRVFYSEILANFLFNRMSEILIIYCLWKISPLNAPKICSSLSLKNSLDSSNFFWHFFVYEILKKILL